MKAPWIVLLCPFLVSIIPWIVTVLLLGRATPQQLEAGYYVTTLVGAVSFVVTAPLAGVCLSLLMRRTRLGLGKFAALFYAVSFPVLAFESVAYSSSLIPALLPSLRTVESLSEVVAWSSLVSILIYALYLVVFYQLARLSVRVTAAVAGLVIILSLILIATQITRI